MTFRTHEHPVKCFRPSIEVMTRGDVSGILHIDTFHFRQLLPHHEHALIPTKSSVGTYGPVAGDYDRKWVPGQSHTNGARTRWLPQIHSNSLAGARILGVLHARLVRPFLEHRAEIKSSPFQRETDIPSLQESLNLVTDLVDFDAGG
jgi:hypothetical protein